MVRGKERFLTQAYSICDFLITQLAFFCSWYLKFSSSLFGFDEHLSFLRYLSWSITYGLIAILLGFYFSLYISKRKKRFAYEIGKIIQVHLISLLILVSLLYLYKEIDVSRVFLGLFVLISILFVILFRSIIKIVLRNIRLKGYNKHFILIMGAGHLGKKFYKNVCSHPEMGFEVVGFLDDFLIETGEHYKPVLGKIEDLSSVLEGNVIDEVILALPLRAHEMYPQIIETCEKAGIKLSIIPDFYKYLPAKSHFDNFAGIPLINVRDIPLDEMNNRFWKRFFDIVFSLCALIVTSPILFIITLVIKLTSPGPVFFKQERVGLNRRTFLMYKFRSMHVSNPEISDTVWTTENDARRTKFGSFLRRTSLDELPQFINVLIGDMSVVGPRPERPYFVEQFKEEIPKYMIKHHVRPGITGWAQANGLRGDTSIKDRIIHDIFYIENWTLLFDIKIIWKTVINGFVNKNAY